MNILHFSPSARSSLAVLVACLVRRRSLAESTRFMFRCQLCVMKQTLLKREPVQVSEALCYTGFCIRIAEGSHQFQSAKSSCVNHCQSIYSVATFVRVCWCAGIIQYDPCPQELVYMVPSSQRLSNSIPRKCCPILGLVLHCVFCRSWCQRSMIQFYAAETRSLLNGVCGRQRRVPVPEEVA